MRFTTLALLGAALAYGQAFAPMGDLRFEVGTIRPSPTAKGGGWLHPEPGGRRYIGQRMSLHSYLWVAYQVKPEQIAGGPSWVDNEPFDLNAEAERSSKLEDLHIMLQNFLTEKFSLKFHFENKEMRAYVLTEAKGGAKNLKLRANSTGGDVFLDQETRQLVHDTWRAHCSPLDAFAWKLEQILDHPVINQTGLKGCFDFSLTFTRDLPLGVQDGQLVNGEAVDVLGPTVFEALEQQLGLKLEEKRAPVSTLVIDQAERPNED